MIKLSAVIIVLNEEKNIPRCLESVKPVADEIVVVDSMSTDNTYNICIDFGCHVIQRKFDGYCTQKQFAVDHASNDWVLYIDADEVISAELKEEILQMKMDSSISHAGYKIQSSLHFMGRTMKNSGVGNEYHLRLFNRKQGRFNSVPVHECIQAEGTIGTLKGKVIHYSYRDISHHLEKINIYTSLAAEGYRKKGKSFSKSWVALKFPFSFFSFYFIKGGFLDGYPGFMWPFLAAVYATLKVAKTIESFNYQ
jgi:glycosyltransferase involved in cell wall biosynthesis